MQLIRACIDLAIVPAIGYIKESNFQLTSGLDQYIQIMIWYLINVSTRHGNFTCRI